MTSPSQIHELSVSPLRLNLLRLLYALLVVGLGLTIWPSLIHHWQAPSPVIGLFSGVTKSMLATLSVLSLLGLRYPLKMLPLLMFEMTWKLIWSLMIAYPMYRDHGLDQDTIETLYECAPIVVFYLIVPWDYILKVYGFERSERWA